MRSSHLTILLGGALLVLGACEKTPRSEATPESVAPATVAAAATAEGAGGGEAPAACCDGEAKAAAAGDEAKVAAGGDEAPAACCHGAAEAAAAGGDEAKAGCDGAKADCAGACDGCKDKAACAGAASDGREADCPFAEAHKHAQAEASGAEAEMGCPHAAAAQRAAEEAAGTVATPEGDKHFGAPFALTEAKPLAALLAADPASANDAVVQVSGVIDQVCQKKGCWLVVRDGDKTARITMMDHAFVVPVDSKGKQVVVEGTLGVRTFNEEQVKHLETDRGGNPDEVSGTRTEVVVKASGVRIRG